MLHISDISPLVHMFYICLYVTHINCICWKYVGSILCTCQEHIHHICCNTFISWTFGCSLCCYFSDVFSFWTHFCILEVAWRNIYRRGMVWVQMFRVLDFSISISFLSFTLLTIYFRKDADLAADFSYVSLSHVLLLS